MRHTAQAALMHEMQHPGYVQEIYNPFQRSVRIAAANPGFTAEQVEMAAREDEDASRRLKPQERWYRKART
jgi:hypothetical protein